ncbi:MAG TPA: DUF3830 family protein [Bryobacteraceae bacterium]|nr:DUF3830 family protein [Bryobacteraceae bacterium]
MSRRIRLSFPATGESVIAEMLDEEAPAVCDYVWSLLPIETRAIHGMYSGAEVFQLIDHPQPVTPQNRTSLPLPGELLYFYDTGGNVTSSPRAVGEVCIVYGRGVSLKTFEGTATDASLFARIPGDWKHDWKEFAQACRRCRWEGPQLLRIEAQCQPST